MIEPIARADDPRISPFTHVGDHDWLRAHGFFVAEGRLLVRRLLEAGRFRVDGILLTPAALQGYGGAIDTDAPVFVAEPEILERITGFNFHRGCLALAHRPPDDVATGRFLRSDLLLALEGVGNPDNVGGLFRVAAAFEADGLLLDPRCGDPFYRKAVRTSMGATLNLPFERAAPWPAVLEEYKAMDFTIVALTPESSAVPLAEFAATARFPLIVMVGAEGPGLTQDALRVADVRVRIPIAPDVDSLNVVVAAGIALAYLSR